MLLIGVMVALYGGYATPSETAGLGAVLALALIAVAYHVWRPRDLAPILGATLKESTMLMFIIGMSLLFSYVMSYLHISQSAAHAIVAWQLSKWLLLAAILLMVVVLGFFLPPVSIILMTAPIILPPLRAAGFDLIWFGVLMTIVMEMGLIHPPVGLNIFVIKNIAPDIPLADVIWGVLPFVVLMFVAIVLICVVPRDRDGLSELGDGSGANGVEGERANGKPGPQAHLGMRAIGSAFLGRQLGIASHAAPRGGRTERCRGAEARSLGLAFRQREQALGIRVRKDLRDAAPRREVTHRLADERVVLDLRRECAGVESGDARDRRRLHRHHARAGNREHARRLQRIREERGAVADPGEKPDAAHAARAEEREHRGVLGEVL